MFRWALPICLALSACIEVPELDQAVPEWVDSASYPALIPLDGLQTGAPPPEEEAGDLEADLAARSARLKRKADDLSAPVVDPDTRARMAGGVAQ